MFDFLKKKELIHFISPMSGKMIDLCDVKDEAFSSKQLGDGFAIQYCGEVVYAPVDGEIVACFPTGHAVGIQCGKIEILLHIGIDTVELNGEGFELLVKQGQRVKQGDSLIKVQSSFIKAQGYDPTSMVIFTSGEQVKLLKLNQEVKEKESKVIQLCGN